jgi:hypothetical protein
VAHSSLAQGQIVRYEAEPAFQSLRFCVCQTKSASQVAVDALVKIAAHLVTTDAP